MKLKDTDFLHASARVKSLEKNLLSARQLAQMVDAHTHEEAYKIANDAGIGTGTGVTQYEEALRTSLLDAYRLMAELSGGRDIFDLFRYEHDGLNLKILIKAQALEKDAELTGLGTITPDVLREMYRQKKFDKLPKSLADGALEALDVLARTGDPQSVDIVIDKAVLAAMSAKAGEYDSRFINKLVAARIDIANIRSLVRIRRMDQGTDLFKRVVAPGGTLSESSLIDACTKGMDQIVAYIESTTYGSALEPAMAEVRAGGTLTLFEKLCDNYLVRMMDEARLIPFGIEPLVVYINAKENEIKAARIVLASRLAGVAPDQIRERLRESYA